MFKKLVIIGGGPAGGAAALAGVAGACDSVVVIERETLGGTCTNRGCIPTKFLLSRAVGGGPAANVAKEWPKLLGHKNALVRGLSKSMETRLRERGVEILWGNATFVNENEVSVSTPGGGLTRVEGQSFIIATGSSPADLPGSPCDGDRIINSTDALDLRTLPSTLAVVGSGAVGAELATVFARLGVKVTIIEAADRLFPVEDPDVDPVFRRVYERMGVGVRTGDPVVAIEKRGPGVAVQLQSGLAVEAEKVLVAVGRTLASRGLGLEAAGVEIDGRGGVLVDDDLGTSRGHIHSAGDVTGRMLLAHAAAYMGEFAARRALGLDFPPVPYLSIPWATFTNPEVGAVGLTVEAAGRQGLDCRADAVPLMDNVKARIDRTTDGFFKVVSERVSGRIVGATVVGPHASDIIHSLALSIHQKLTKADMRGFAFIHPSISESFCDLF